MAKSKEEVTEEVTWTITATIVAENDKQVETAIEQIEAGLDTAAEDVEWVENYGVTLS